jgi:hypothetical protein
MLTVLNLTLIAAIKPHSGFLHFIDEKFGRNFIDYIDLQSLVKKKKKKKQNPHLLPKMIYFLVKTVPISS